MAGANYKIHSDGEIAYEVHEYFTGTPYENEHTMANDSAYRFETTETKLRSAEITISTQNALIGDSSNQRYPKATGATFAVEDVDLSKLYFKNATAGQNTKINIIGVKI